MAPAGGGRPELATAAPWLTSDSRRRPPPPFWQGDGGQKGTPAAAVPPLPQARGDGLECWRPVEHLARLRGRRLKKIERVQVAALDGDGCEAVLDGADFPRAIAAQSVRLLISASVLIE